MERKKHKMSTNVDAQIQALTSELVARASFAARLGLDSFGGDRDIYEALGYKRQLLYADFASRYERQDIAKAVIDRPANATWQGELSLEEESQAEETELERSFKELDDALGLKSKFNRVDKLCGIGGYSVLLLGLDDVRKREDWISPVRKGARKLLYVKPCSKETAKIQKYEDRPNNKRYGLPLIYEITIADVTSGSTTITQTVFVHYSRVIHVVEDVLENDVIGIPKLEVIYNRLMDLEKIVGGDAETFWRNARPGFQGKVDPNYQLTPEMKEDLKAQINEYEHNLRRMLVNEGVSYEELKQAISDPSNHVDIQIQMISTVTGIPKRILTGTERGELSSNQDASEWRSFVGGRRLDHAEPHIVRLFVNRCIEIQVLPDPIDKKYKVVWSDLYAPSEADQVKIGLDRSSALRNYVTSPLAEAVLSPEAFLMYCMGLSDNQLAIINSKKDSEIIKETKSILKLITPEEPKQPVAKQISGRKPMTRRTPPNPAKQ